MRRLLPYLPLSANIDQDQERVLYKQLEISIFIWPELNILWNSWIDSTFTKKLQRSVFDDFISRKGCAFSVYCLFILSLSCSSSIWNIQRHLEASYWRVSSIYLSLTVPSWEQKAKWHNIHLCMWQDKLLFCPPEQYTAQDIICGRRIFSSELRFLFLTVNFFAYFRFREAIFIIENSSGRHSETPFSDFYPFHAGFVYLSV